MITVKFFGLLRLDEGIKSVEVENVKTVKQLYDKVEAATNIPVKTLKECNIFINGKRKKFNQKLQDGDEVMLLVPSCGG